MKCPPLHVFFLFGDWIFFMATILQLKVAKRQPFEKVSLERCSRAKKFKEMQFIKLNSGHLIGCGKNLKIMRKFSAILCGRKWRLCGKDARLCGNFYNLITLLPWLFPTYKTHVNVLPIILVLYDPFDLLLPFVDTYFFVQRNFSMVFEGFRCVCPKLSNQALIRTRKTGQN